MGEEPKFWSERYKVSHPSYWQGRSDAKEALRFHERVQIIDLEEGFSPSVKRSLNFGLIGFACDEGVQRNQGRAGAADGPNAIRRALAKLAVHLSDDTAVLDIGDVVCTDEDLEASQRGLAGVITRLHQEKIIPVIMGGGHEVAWGHYQGIVSARPMERVGIINIDAHFDLRPLPEDGRGNSGTPFTQIAKLRQESELPFDYLALGIQRYSNTSQLFKVAEELGASYVTSSDFHERKTENISNAIDRLLDEVDKVYVTICMDVFGAAFAPGASAPQPTGLAPWQVIPWIQYLAKSGKVIGFELAELSPPLDEDGRTAALAAHLIAHYMQSEESTRKDTRMIV